MMQVTAAIELVLQLLAQAARFSQLIAAAHADGRTEITDQDLDAVVGADDAARAKLVAAIEEAKAAGH